MDIYMTSVTPREYSASLDAAALLRRVTRTRAEPGRARPWTSSPDPPQHPRVAGRLLHRAENDGIPAGERRHAPVLGACPVEGVVDDVLRGFS